MVKTQSTDAREGVADEKELKKAAKDAEGEEKLAVEEDKKALRVRQQQEDIDPDKDDPAAVSPRDPDLKTAEHNSAPHPELWPVPSGDLDSEPPEGSKAGIDVFPKRPGVNFEYTLKAHGLPINRGLTWRLQESERPDTWFTHKSDPFGDAHVVWRTQLPGKVKVNVHAREADGSKGKSLASTTVEIIDPAEDRRFGEERGAG